MDGLILLIGVIYLLPAAVAQVPRHYQTTAIVGLTLLLGWTFVGWAVALVRALTATLPQRGRVPPKYLDALDGVSRHKKRASGIPEALDMLGSGSWI
jgi:hypothetical protein